MYHQDLSDFIIGQNDDGTFYIQSSNFRAQAADGYVGKTARKFMESTTKLEILRKDLTDAGLTAWKLINEGSDDVPVTCTNTHINGSKVAYNGGFYMLPTGFTPASNEFTMEGMYGAPVVDDVAKTITVVYAPTICFTAENVTVVQGNRTTGKGNKRQILLRIKVVLQAPCHPKSFSVTLTNGASEIEKVEAYMTSSEQLDAEGARPVKLGEQGQTADWTPWVAGFYKTNTVLQLAANRAYLETTVPGDPSGSRVGFDISLDDEGGEPTGIRQLDNGERIMDNAATTGWYTLDGRKISTAPSAKGIYIMNGRKVVIK